MALAPTRLEYFNDTYKFASTAKILDFQPGEAKSEATLILDETIFHPQGGGQPTDVGSITSVASGTIFDVTKVALDPATGVVHHYGNLLELGSFSVGEEVKLQIDSAKREHYARLHSAGHLLDVAMTQSGFKMQPGKGYHFPQGAYVEYIGNIPADERERAKVLLQESIDKLIADDLPVNVRQVPFAQLSEACSTRPPSGLDEDKGHRVVSLGDFRGCMCGGTHIKSSSQLRSCVITKFKKKGKNFRVSYRVDV